MPGEPAAVERWWRDPSGRIERSVYVHPPPDADLTWASYRYDERSRLTERREERTDGVVLETRTLEGDVSRSWNELDPCPQLLPEGAWEIVEQLEALRDVAGGDGVIHAKLDGPLRDPTEWHATIRAGRPVECHYVSTSRPGTGDIRTEIVHRYGWSAEGIATVDRVDTWTARVTPGPPSSVVVERAGGLIARVTLTHRERTEQIVTRDGAGRVASVGTGSPESFTGFRFRHDAEGREIERATWERGTLLSTLSTSFACPTPLPAMPPGARR